MLDILMILLLFKRFYINEILSIYIKLIIEFLKLKLLIYFLKLFIYILISYKIYYDSII